MGSRLRSRVLAFVIVCVLAASGAPAAGAVSAAGNVAPIAADDPLSMNRETAVVPADVAAWDQAGRSVAIDGDVAVVGAATAEDNAGYVCVYERTGGMWGESARLVSPDPGADEFFGWSVAVEGDTIVVGEYRDQDGGVSKGAAHVFVRSGDAWTHAAKLVPAPRVTTGEFGCDVAISGDTIVVGSYGWVGSGGAVYVFRGGGASWTEEKLITTPAHSSYQFGSSVDVDGDTLVAGCEMDDAKAFDAGAVYVYVRSGTDWSFQQQLTASDGASTDYLGHSVAIAGNRVLTGAHADDDLGNWSGAAYLFTRSGSTWTQTSKILPSNGGEQEDFGYAVDFDGATAVIGAPGGSRPAERAGSAYVYALQGNLLSEQVELEAADASLGAWYGSAVAADGTTCVVGAHQAGPQLQKSGEAYLYDSFYEAVEDTQLSVDAPGVLTNDWDSDMEWFGVADWTDPAHGTVSMFSNGAFLYTPEPGFNGWDSFTYRAWDDFGAFSAPATVRIHVAAVPDYVAIEGDDRFETAAEAARAAFSDAGAPVAIVATGRNFPDALGGAALAGALDAPLLLVDTSNVPESTADVLAELGTKHAIVLGGRGAVDAMVETQLLAAMGAGSSVERIEGADRYETARKVAARTIDELGVLFDGIAFVATGRNFPDALAAGPLAAHAGMPIYLVNNTAADGATIQAIEDEDLSFVAVLGGTGVVTEATFGALEGVAGSVERYWGENRYGTAAAVAGLGVEEMKLVWDGLGVATGEAFPDALAAGPALARFGTVLVLSRPTALPAETEGALTDHRAAISDVRYFGGPNALSAEVRAKVASLVEAP